MFQVSKDKEEWNRKLDAMLAHLNSDEYFNAMEKSILSGQGGFGNPDSKLTTHQQFLLWRRWMKQKELFADRDDFHNKMALYSSYGQAQQHLDSLYQPGPVSPEYTLSKQSFQQI